MKKHIQISVPSPCREKWDSFTQTGQGGFCSSCQKEVIDFTSWSDERLKGYFKNLPRNTCGRFRREQLKVYSYEKAGAAPYGWISVFFAGGLILFSARQTFGQQRNDFAHHPTEQYQRVDSVGKIVVGSLPLTLTGVVNSPEDGLPIPGVNVVCKGTVDGTTTDVDGRFSITLKNSDATPTLVFSFIGFETVEYTVSTTAVMKEIRIDMLYDAVALGETVIVGGCRAARWYSPRTWWWKIKGLF